MRSDIPEPMQSPRAAGGRVGWSTLLLIATAVVLGSSEAAAQDPPTLPAPRDTAIRPVGPVRPGDVLVLRMLGQEGITGEYTIDNEGIVTVPGVGTLRLAGMTPTDARAAIDRAMRTRFANPEHSADFRIRVYVLGAGVANPGPFVVEPGTTFLQVLAIAGGQTDRADLRGTTVNRENRTYPVNLEAALAGSHVGQLPVFSNDVVVVPVRRGLTRENINLGLSLLGTALTLVTLFVSLRND